MTAPTSGHNPPTDAFAPDCRHYRGDRPCEQNRLCAGCDHYEPWAQRICIIKLGALGDVIRTLCILPQLRHQYPAAHITWVTKPNGKRMIENHPQIDRVLTLDAMSSMVLGQEQFDLVICLDKEPQPCALAGTLNAKQRLGVGLSAWGAPVPLNDEAEAYFQLGLSDELKFRTNTKSYPQLVYEALGWQYDGQRYELPVTAYMQAGIDNYFAQIGVDAHRPLIGINVGSGDAFANKMWPAARLIELIVELNGRDREQQIVLLGGPPQRQAIDYILEILDEMHVGARVFDGGTDHHEQAFVALIDRMDVVFCGDTMAMHAAIARERQVVAFFGPTCEQEIDLFGKGEKLLAQMPCSPCYKRACDQEDACVKQITAAHAADAIERALERHQSQTHSLPTLPSRRAG